MVSRQDIQRLIHRPSTGRTILSLFLDMAVNSDNKRTYGIFLAKQKGRFSELDSDREAHHRVELGAALARAERWIEENFDESNKGLALYAEIGGAWTEGFQVGVSLQNRLDLADHPIIAPLAEVVETQPHYGVLVIDRDSLRMVGLRSGQVLTEHVATGQAYPTPNDVQAGGEAQKDYQKRKEQERRHFFKDFAREALEYDRRDQPDYLILLGTEENVKQFTECLAPQLQAKIVYTAPGPAGPRTSDIVQRLLPFFSQRARAEETRAVQVLHDRVRNRHFAAAGVQQTLEQLQEGKVETLVIARDLRKPGAQCQKCGFFLARRDGACPYCGGELREGIDLAEAMVRLAEEQEIPVEFVSQQALADVSGAGALLKF